MEKILKLQVVSWQYFKIVFFKLFFFIIYDCVEGKIELRSGQLVYIILNYIDYLKELDVFYENISFLIDMVYGLRFFFFVRLVLNINQDIYLLCSNYY